MHRPTRSENFRVKCRIYNISNKQMSILWLTTIPIINKLLELLKYILIRSLRTSKLPNHVAFIMDGNRRYAKERNMPVSSGHDMGSETLSSILELCYELDIRAVSVYAFSIENFKRSKTEVNYLMVLIKQKLAHILENGELVDRFGVKVMFSGNMSYLPKDVYQQFEHVEKKTAHNNNVILNICFPYTARDDIVRSLRQIITQTKTHEITPELITAETVGNNLDTSILPPLEFLVRTSGVKRLSDYLLWEVTSNQAEIEFLDVYWPQLSQVILTWCFFKWCWRKSSLSDFYTKVKSE